jgi:flagellar basal body-associated protein FliL
MKNIIKKIIFIIIIVLLFCAVGYFAIIKTEEKEINDKIENMFENLTSDQNNSEKQEVFDNIGNSDADNSNYISLFSKISYSVIKIDAGWKKADVTIEITNKNMKEIITNYLAQTFKLALANTFSNTYTDEEIEEQLNSYLQEQLDSDEIENITTEITVTFIKEDGNWNLAEENKTDLINAILPEFSETINQINTAFSEENN